MEEKQHPFDETESLIWSMLKAINDEFVKLETTHPDEMTEWSGAIHQIQSLVILRAFRRNYPGAFVHVEKNGEK